MTIQEKLKIERLLDTYRRNFAFSHMQNKYLTLCPEAIRRDMIDELMRDAGIDKRGALEAYLTGIFGLDYDNADDRVFIRDYIPATNNLNETITIYYYLGNGTIN